MIPPWLYVDINKQAEAKGVPSSSLDEVEVEVGVDVGDEVRVEVGVEFEVKVSNQNYFFGVAGWLEIWRIKQSSNLKLKLELGNRCSGYSIFNDHCLSFIEFSGTGSKTSGLGMIIATLACLF